MKTAIIASILAIATLTTSSETEKYIVMQTSYALSSGIKDIMENGLK